MLDDDRADVVQAARFLVGHDQVLPVVLRHATHRLDRDGPPDGVGQIAVRQPLGGEPRRVGDDFDLPHVRALDVHPPHSGDARNERLDLIASDVVQRGGVAALEIVRQDREE